MKKSFTTWRTRDGRRIKVKKMEDAHLANTINYLKRRIASGEYKEPLEIHTCPVWDIDDGPCYGCENDEIVRADLEQWVVVLTAEQTRRANVEHV